MRELARQLVAATQAASDSNVHDAVAVCERLRTPLTRLAGADGFTSLLRRALALASAEAPSLQHVKIGADGRLEGLESPARSGTGGETWGAGKEPRAQAAVAITAHMLGLLVTFIGEPITRRLLCEAWPETPPDEWHSRSEVDR